MLVALQKFWWFARALTLAAGSCTGGLLAAADAPDAVPFQGMGAFGPFAIHTGGTLESTIFEDYRLVPDHREIIQARHVFGDPPLNPDRVRSGVFLLLEQLDKLILFSARNGVDSNSLVTLNSKMTSEGYKMDYIPEGKELVLWKQFVGLLVERYDGDSDYGCMLRNQRTGDCSFPGEVAYPDAELQSAIRDYPIKHWQIEQEWLHTIYVEGDDPAAQPPYVLADGPTLDAHFDDMKAVIKAADPEALIVTGAMNPSKPQMLEEGFVRAGFVENFDDCNYQFHTVESLAEASQIDKDYRAAYEEKFEYVMWHTAPKADIIDIHMRVRQDPYLLQESIDFLWSKMPVGTDVEIWGLEISGPFYYFPLMGVEPPGWTDPTYCHDSTNLAPYDLGIQADFLLKVHAIGFASGLKSVFYAAGNPEVNFEANYQRNALIDIRTLSNPLEFVEGWDRVVFQMEGRKPAYFTYALMMDLLEGFQTATELDRGVIRFGFDGKSPVYLVWEDVEGGAQAWLQSLPATRQIGVIPPIRRAGQDSSTLETLLPGQLAERLSDIPVFVLGAER